jgi:hypothetical protein
MSDPKEKLEQAGPIRVEVQSDGGYGIGWKSATRPNRNVLVADFPPRSEITMQIELGESVKDEVECKRLWVRVSCDGAIGEHHDDQPVNTFHDDEHAIRWLDYMIRYLNRHLPERLRLMALLTVREAIAQSSEVQGVATTDWAELAETHGALVTEKIKQTHRVHKGPARLFETKQHYLNFLAEAARACRSAGARFTQKFVADFGSDKFSNERALDERAVRQWNKEYKVNWKYWSDKVNRRN